MDQGYLAINRRSYDAPGNTQWTSQDISILYYAAALAVQILADFLFWDAKTPGNIQKQKICSGNFFGDDIAMIDVLPGLDQQPAFSLEEPCSLNPDVWRNR